ncbi:MAG: 1,4-alpha-glucan branching protein GlgB [Desulfonatronovibrionaceae bacterium]
MSILAELDIFLFKQGRHFQLHKKLGSHPYSGGGVRGTYFAVWAPNALEVSVIGDFNSWKKDQNPMHARSDGSGIWETFIPGVEPGTCYKYSLKSRYREARLEKTDPFALRTEEPPKTASIVWGLDFKWTDQTWMENRSQATAQNRPISIYEMHLGSWMRDPDNPERLLSYRELAELLPKYLQENGFTHVEFMPLCEHPFYGSWGYQCVSYFAPSSRYGLPQDFMHLIDRLHKHGIGVILDWVPSHFPTDDHSLGLFDGTHLFEHMDSRRGFHPDWHSYIFNYGRYEVQAFLISNALFWLDKYHIDGLRVDAVASMLYLNYSRKEGEWLPNEYGGNENLEAISFLKKFNETVYQEFPGVQTFAEESTSWPMVSRPTYIGGLGFGYKWNMGWMNDTLDYFQKDPVYRRFHHNQLTFSIWYAFNENFVLPLSHDEVVHGKSSLFLKMPGDRWQKFANLRLLFGYMFAHPGKKLVFMGSELGQKREWDHDRSLDWHLLQNEQNRGLKRWIADLNRLYVHEPCLYELDFSPQGFAWIDCQDADNSVLAFSRYSQNKDCLVAAFNFTPVPRFGYCIPAPAQGTWKEVINSDSQLYGGSNQGNMGGIETRSQGEDNILSLTLPPLGMIMLRPAYGQNT